MDTSHRPFGRRDGINWTSVVAFSIFHIGAIAALFFFTWPAFFVFLALYWISLSLGIGMGYHRLLTHRSYKVPKGIEYFLAVCGSLALVNNLINKTIESLSNLAHDFHVNKNNYFKCFFLELT